ncbi:MAG: hypothetical protein IPG74_02760 [Flavobacteriales bacterium]|nr:hypothetical protein [Flavobacteriales bacterium]
MSSDHVRCLFRASRGTLWLGTPNGLDFMFQLPGVAVHHAGLFSNDPKAKSRSCSSTAWRQRERSADLLIGRILPSKDRRRPACTTSRITEVAGPFNPR